MIERFPDPETCWTRKTPFQVGLILTLCVTVPFCITMLVIYVVSCTKLRNTGECADLCRYQKRIKAKQVAHSSVASGVAKSLHIGYTSENNSTQLKVRTFDDLEFDEKNDATRFHPRRRSLVQENYAKSYNAPLTDPDFQQFSTEDKTNRISLNDSDNYGITTTSTLKCFDEPPTFSSIAALLENLYSDDSEEQIIKCPVVVLAANWVLALEDCVDDDGTQSLSVRINSNFWSKDGILKKVKTVVTVDGFVAINLVGNEDDSCFFPIGLSHDVADEGAVYFWNGDITLPLAKKSRYESIQLIGVKFQKFENRVVFEDSIKCGGQNGAPVLDTNQNLIGFLLESCGKKAGRLYKPLNKYLDWQKIIEIVT